MNSFNRRSLRFCPLAARKNKLNIEKSAISPGSHAEPLAQQQDQITRLVQRIIAARRANKPVVMAFGAHLVKNCLSPVVIKLMEDGWITHLATNGAGSIHDWEFAFQGESSEDVRANVANGTFGIWEETGRWINLSISTGGLDGLGYGASVGRMIAEDGLTIPSADSLRTRVAHTLREDQPGEQLGALSDMLYLVTAFGLEEGRAQVDHPFKRYSLQCAAYKLGIAFTVHPGIGYDIIHTHPLSCGATLGRGAMRDFLTYADSISRLAGGVHMSVGSAIMAPMVFEKSMSMANNLALAGTGKPVSDHYMAVVDIQEGGGWDWGKGEPPPDNPAYYLRFCKSFHRMGGTLDYICLDNRQFLLHLAKRLSAAG